MIDLRINQYRLTWDGIQWSVVRVATVQKGDNAGAERETDHGYHGRLSHALQDVMDRLAGSGEAESVQALHAAVDTHARAIYAAAADVERQLMAMRYGGGEPPF